VRRSYALETVEPRPGLNWDEPYEKFKRIRG